MSENFTQVEWDGLLRGKAMPGDIFVGEQMSSYLHRKFQDLIDANEALKRDAERLDYLMSSGAIIASFSGVQGHKFWLEWPQLCEKQATVYQSEREAIDAAMESQK